MGIKVKSMKVPSLDVAIFEFSDGMKARVEAQGGGFGGSEPELAKFYLVADGNPIVEFTVGKGFIPVKGGYKNMTLAKIVEYILKAAKYAASKFKPGNYGTPNEVHAHYLMASSRNYWQDIKDGKYPLPS